MSRGSGSADTTGAETTDSSGLDGDVDPILSVDGVKKTFDGVTALDGVSFGVESETLTGLIGPNGAGKSTTFNVISGAIEPDVGRVTFDGEDITGLEPYQTSSRGLVRTFQIAREFETMTVLENMMLPPTNQRGEAAWQSILPGTRGSVRKEEADVFERAWEMLEFFDIDHLALEDAGALSGGQRKLLELARALMLDPEVLLLDEPFAGVNPSLEQDLLDRLEDLQDRGRTFLLVEHDMDLIMEHCERVIVMHQGRTLVTGTPEEVRSEERVVEAYLGGDVS